MKKLINIFIGVIILVIILSTFSYVLLDFILSLGILVLKFDIRKIIWIVAFISLLILILLFLIKNKISR